MRPAGAGLLRGPLRILDTCASCSASASESSPPACCWGLLPMWDQGEFCGTAFIRVPNSADGYVALGPSGGAPRADPPTPCDSWHSTGSTVALGLLGAGVLVVAAAAGGPALLRRRSRVAG
jgi:hypothetical protein